MLDEPRNDLSPAALTLEATTASPATMTREPQGRPAAPTSRQPQEENPVSNNSRVCTGTSRQLSSAPAHHALVYSNLCKGQTGRRRRETFISRSRFPPYHYRPIPVLALNPLAYICLAGRKSDTVSSAENHGDSFDAGESRAIDHLTVSDWPSVSRPSQKSLPVRYQ